MFQKEDQRQSARHQLKALFQVSWLDSNGQVRTGTAELVEISEGGFSLDAREAPHRESRVRFVCNRLKLFGTGQIRYCTRRGVGYRIGVEFLEGTRWRPAPERTANVWDWGFSRA